MQITINVSSDTANQQSGQQVTVSQSGTPQVKKSKVDWGYRACAGISLMTVALVTVKPLNMPIKQFFHSTTHKTEASTSSVSSGDFIVPVANHCVTSEFGMRKHPLSGMERFHAGIDLADAQGTPVMAAKDGEVISAGSNGGYGNQVAVDHGGGIVSTYAHLSQIRISKGKVKKGDVIGLMGSTGSSTAPHLHLEIKVNGKPENPRNFIQFKRLREGC